MKKTEKKFWTNEEVETLLEMAADEFRKEFRRALKSQGKSIKKKQPNPVPFNPERIIAKVNGA